MPDFTVRGSGSYDDWSDPFTGNGFTKATGDLVPEWQTSAGSSMRMREGAEMWEVLDTGTQRLTAVLLDGEWVRVGGP